MDDADDEMREARARFVAGFSTRISGFHTLFDRLDEPEAAASLRADAHKLIGLSGVLGFPTVSRHAAALEEALLRPEPDRQAARTALDGIAAGFAGDLSGGQPGLSTAATGAPSAHSERILLVEDDDEQRRLSAAMLRSAGFRVITAGTGPEAVEAARDETPNLILLDVDLPGFDGMTVCTKLRLMPALASVPVIFCTARTSLIDRMAGLTLGADDYVTKPFAPSELLFRIRRHLAARARMPAAAPVEGLLSYEEIVKRAGPLLSQGIVTVVLLRAAPGEIARLGARLVDELRRRDLVGRYRESCAIAVLPDMPASSGRAGIERIASSLAPPIPDLAVGAADGSGAQGSTLETLIERADLALAEERVRRGEGASRRPAVLVAEDDPDVMHIVDARLKSAGYRTLLAFYGQQTLDVIDADAPAVLLLDLMMPKLTGFDVLTRLRALPTRPRTIVLSGRGRDEDVTRAFELGADDYLTKPFNPDELIARVARLTR
jgi:DNA-binding response OmpR family regulator/HPt (histidine-containing phosphotransfer) domain-containing protein